MVGQQLPSKVPAAKTERKHISSDEISVYKVALAWFAKDGVWPTEKANRRFSLKRSIGALKVEWILRHDKECLKGLGLQPSKASRFEDEDSLVLSWPLLSKNVDVRAGAASLPDHVAFTAVSFDKDKKYAAVGYDAHCGPTCGRSGLLVFRNEKAVWVREPRPCMEVMY